MNEQPYKMGKDVEAKFAEAVKALMSEAKERRPELMGLGLDLHAEVVPDAGIGVLAARVMLVLDPTKAPAPDPGIPGEVDQLIRSSQATLQNRRKRPPEDGTKEG